MIGDIVLSTNVHTGLEMWMWWSIAFDFELLFYMTNTVFILEQYNGYKPYRNKTDFNYRCSVE